MYLEKYNLDGKISVVTGGTQGIGLAIAEALAEAGSRVVALTNDQDQIPSATERMTELGYEYEARVLDVTNSTAVADMAAQIESEVGAVDILVNNAAISPAFIGAESTPDELYLKVLDVNLNGVFWCSRSFGAAMLKRGTGSIVNIGSMSGVISNIPQDHSPYNISKAGVHHLTKSLAAEWAAEGVRVNCVAPTYIETKLTAFGMTENPEMAEVWLDMTPMGRVGQPDEIASVVLFLASDAASLMTGSIVMADAGYTLW
ncbi:3-oxoacyl-ACP reductase [Leucobacter sp. UCD-THU]|uniref:SDR family NAD(P)-dependent oxidoreductase n=1 Tax=Leucobacter sp. UCD-THU TaxID=1292023 RepID=UPI00045F699C|nr:SDR family oxidoreductase [Leucobacter sp. UCD-THU]EYT56595.1 3-oxoacyl-ACP reductase [Leucobacter sp. UCD-THU]